MKSKQNRESWYIISIHFSKNDTRYFVGLDDEGEYDWTIFRDLATTFFGLEDAERWQGEVGGSIERV